jgi:two-component sensor histidine kinase
MIRNSGKSTTGSKTTSKPLLVSWICKPTPSRTHAHLQRLRAANSGSSPWRSCTKSLSQSLDLGRMDGAAYLRGLATALRRAYAAEARHLTLTITADDVWLRAEMAIPCGLILNELLANALKHAFPVGGPGAIEVALRADPMGICVLNIRDNGVGFPVGLDFRQTDPLGLQLVCLLIEQQRGTIEMTAVPLR